jgi:hypothetical protein
LVDVEWSLLIYIVVEPVREKEVGMSTPTHDRLLGWVVVLVVVLR